MSYRRNRKNHGIFKVPPRYRSTEELKAEIAEIRAKVLASKGYSSKPLTDEQRKLADHLFKQYQQFGMTAPEETLAEVEDAVQAEFHRRIDQERRQRAEEG